MSGFDALSTLAAQAAEQAERLERMQRTLAGVEGHGSAPGSGVTARATPQGALLDLTLPASSLGLGAEALAKEVLAAARAAHADATRQAQEIMASQLGPLAAPSTNADDGPALARIDALTATLEDLTQRLTRR